MEIETRIEKQRRYRKNWESRNFENRLWNNAKRNARNKNREFNLEVSDIVIPEYCPIMKLKLTRGVPEGRADTNASLDCIDPSKGYVKGNVWVISFIANRMKQNATKEQLQQFCLGCLDIIKTGKI